MARRYFLDCLILTSCLVAVQSLEYALKGGEIFLSPDIRGHPDGILWKHNGNKVVEFDGQEQRVFSSFDNRITLDWVSAKLHITDLRFEDSGDYELEVEINKRLQRSSYKLEVIDKVAKPTISCEMNEGSSSNKSGTLLCSAESAQPQSFMQFEWKIHGSMQPGSELPISLGGEHDDEVYSCAVSNQLSSDTATFTAKDCYANKNSSVALIVGLVVGILVLLGLAILIFCKYRHKACFAKDDLEKRGPTNGTEAPQDDERTSFLDRAPTLLSTQPLRHLVPNYIPTERSTVNAHNVDREDETPRKGHVQKARGFFEENKGGQMSPKELRTERNTDYEDADQHREPAEEKVPQCDNSDSEEENEPDPAGASDDLSASSLKIDVQNPVAPAQPEPDKEADEVEEAQSAPASPETSSSAQPHSALTESLPNMSPTDTAGQHEEDANSDQVSGETAEKNVGESESSVEEGERNESDDSSEDELSSTVPERKDSGTLLHGQEHGKNTSEDNQQDTVKLVSEDENETDSDQEKTDKEPDLYSAASPQQPQSPTSTKPDNRNAEAFPEAQDGGDECKTSHGSVEPAEQSDKGEGETDEDKNEAQCGLKEEKPVSESLSEEKEGQNKDDVVA